MRHLKKGRKLGVTTSHKRAMLSNMATSLIQYESIRTTSTRAKALRPFVERLITRGKKGDLHSRRLVLRVVKDEVVVAKLFNEIAARFVTREGGYTRIIRLGLRAGDGAELALIQLMGAAVVGAAKPEAKGEKKGEKKGEGKGEGKDKDKREKESDRKVEKVAAQSEEAIEEEAEKKD